MVRTQRERKRVSQANRPCVSTGVASMLPARSLTTKVLPSRMLTVFSAIAITHGSLNAETQREVAGHTDRTADRRRDEVLLARNDADEGVGITGQDAVGPAGIVTDGKVAPIDRDPAATRALDVELHGPADVVEQTNMPPFGLLVEEGVDAFDRGHCHGVHRQHPERCPQEKRERSFLDRQRTCASWVRELTPSLRKTLTRWYSTVLALMKSCAAISWFRTP